MSSLSLSFVHDEDNVRTSFGNEQQESILFTEDDADEDDDGNYAYDLGYDSNDLVHNVVDTDDSYNCNYDGNYHGMNIVHHETNNNDSNINNNNNLTTPLLAGDEFMELESSFLLEQTAQEATAADMDTNTDTDTDTANGIAHITAPLLHHQQDGHGHERGTGGTEQGSRQKVLFWNRFTNTVRWKWVENFIIDDDDPFHDTNTTNTTNTNRNRNRTRTDYQENMNDNNNNNNNHNSNNDDETNNFMNVSTSAIFLRDYESSRPCSLSPNIDSITPIQLKMYNIRFSNTFQFLLYTAMLSLFIASCFEGQAESKTSMNMTMSIPNQDQSTYTYSYYNRRILSNGEEQIIQNDDPNNTSPISSSSSSSLPSWFLFISQMICTIFPAIIFTLDVIIRGYYDDDNILNANLQTLYTRKTRARSWKIPLLCMLFAIMLESSLKTLWVGSFGSYDDSDGNDDGDSDGNGDGDSNANGDGAKRHYNIIVWSSILKPIVFFYVSAKARDALSALVRVTKIVFKVIMIELFLILSFATMACHLYFEFHPFRNLSSSFLSLFELSTTTVTPSLWFPVYSQYKHSAFFFILFLIICVFYMHSLVLSVVFQTYIQAMKLIRERSFTDRQEALNLAFLALRPKCDTEGNDIKMVEVNDVKTVLKIVRPHYNDAKIDVLVRVIDPVETGKIDFNTFRMQMPKVLQTSLRSARQSTRNSLLLESLAFFIAIANLIYVLLLSSALNFLMLANLIFPLGSVIVFFGLLEVTLRIRPFRSLQTLSTTRHVFLDGLAIIAGLMSLVGLIAHSVDKNQGLQALLLGRAIDMIRVLRFSSIFRSIIDRTGDVLPALVGPIALVITSLHIYTYSGMAIWGGAVTTGKHSDDLAPLYDLNNFNEYPSGLLTMFNIFVVNDWHVIASVYIHADRYSSPYIVYPFFIGANLVGVSILLNVLTAFFVGSFVTKVESNRKDGQNGNRELRLRMTGQQQSSNTAITLSRAPGTDPTSSCGISAFHVFERQGYDSVIKTVTGDEDAVVFAKKACELLEAFEKLMPTTDPVGYLLCCQQSNDCFGNRHFISLTKGYIEEDKVHGVIDEMFSHLLVSGDESIQQDFPPLLLNDIYHRHLSLSATICQSNPPVGLFVACRKWRSADI